MDLLRGAPFLQGADECRKLSLAIRDTFGAIVGQPLTDRQWEQARLPIRMGGFGIYDPSEVRIAARLAGSIDFARRSTVILGTPGTQTALPSDWPVVFERAQSVLGQAQPLQAWRQQPPLALQADQDQCKQSFWNELLCEAAVQRLRLCLEGQDAVRFSCQTTPHAMAWAAATPAEGLGTLIPSVDFRCLLQFHLGMSVGRPQPDQLPSGTVLKCPRCKVPMDASGHHFVCCHRNGIVQRHGAVQDALFRLFGSAGYSVRKEQAAMDRTRPGDVFIARLDANGPAAVDITVRHPLPPSRPTPSSFDVDRWRSQQEGEKVRKYQAQCQRLGWTLVPFVVDCYGGLGSEARTLVAGCLKQLQAQQETWARRRAEAEAWQGLLVPLAKGVARQLQASLFAQGEDLDDPPFLSHDPYNFL